MNLLTTVTPEEKMKNAFKTLLLPVALLLVALLLGNTVLAQNAPGRTGSRSTLVVKASGSLAANVGPKFELRVNGTSYGVVEVRSSTARDYYFVLRNPLAAGAKIDIIYRNDYNREGQDRNLFVDSVTINGQTVPSTAASVQFEQGAGRRELTTNGTMRFTWGSPINVSGGGAGGGAICNVLPNTTTDVTCPAGFTGIYQRFQTFDPTPGVCRYVATTDNLSSKCKVAPPPAPTPTPTPTCTAQPTLTSNLSCPTGFTGTFTRTQTFNTNPAICAYNAATDNSATACTAVPAPTPTCTTQPTLVTSGLACPSGFTGTYTRTQTFNSNVAVCAYNSPTDNSSTACTPVAPTPTCTAQPTITTNQACPSGFTGTYQITQTFNSTPAVCAYNTPTNNQATACTPVPPVAGTPPLTPEVVIENGYKWRDLRVGAGGFIVGMNLHKDGVQRVIRTDTFGAYIWAGNRWNQLANAERVPLADQEAYGTGVVDVVTAPTDVNRLYMFFRGRVFRSDNQGGTWARTNFAFIDTSPNDDYRAGSFKLAVDPANKDVVYAAARDAAHDEGVRVTTDGGVTWTPISNAVIPAGKPRLYANGSFRDAGGGASIFFDPSGGTSGTGANIRTKNVYISVWYKGIYRSINAGGNWTQISGTNASSPNNGWRTDVASDGTLYVADGDNGSGDAWRYRAGVWTKITPIQYQGLPVARRSYIQTITVDPANPNRVWAFSGSAEAYRSVDGGDHWFGLDNPAIRDGTGDIPWLAWTNEDFFSAAEVRFDPKIPGRLWIAQGIGWWYADVTDSTTRLTWHAESRGIEQLVTNEIVSPPSGGGVNSTVMIGSWDRALFTKEKADLDSYPAQHLVTNRFNSTWSLDWSGQNPNFIVANTSDHRNCGVYCVSDGNVIQAGYSTDGGRNWTRFFTKPVPPGSTTNPIPSGPKSYEALTIFDVNGNPSANPSGYNPYAFWNGDIAVSATDINNIVWVPTDDVRPAYTTDKGVTWNFTNFPAPGAGYSAGWHNTYYLNRKILASDKVLPNTFYMLNNSYQGDPVYNWGPNAGVWRTTDGGANWTQVFKGKLNDFQFYGVKFKAAPGQAGHLFFTPGGLSGNPDAPFLRSTDGGAHWTPTGGGISRVAAFGFGKAQNAGGYPTIFAYGTVNCVSNCDNAFGMYRSTDNGASWVKIGGLPVGRLDSIVTIEGDKDVFGRVYVGFGGSGSAYGEIAP